MTPLVRTPALVALQARRMYGLDRAAAYDDEAPRPTRFQKGGHVVNPPFQGRRRLAELDAREGRQPRVTTPQRAYESRSRPSYGDRYAEPARVGRSFDLAERLPSNDEDYDNLPYDRYEVRSTRDTRDYQHTDPRARHEERYDRQPYETSRYDTRDDRMMAPARPLGRYAYDDAEEASADRRSAYSARRPVTDRRTPGGMGYRAAKKYDASWPPAREREWDYDPAGPPEKGSLANTRKREDKLMAEMLALDLPESFPKPPPGGARFFATFKGVDFTIAHNAYKTFLRDNGVRSARAADVGIKDTALFYVKTPKELRLAMDRLPAPGVTVSITPPDQSGKPTRRPARLNDYDHMFWVIKSPESTDVARLKKVLKKEETFRISDQAGFFRLRFRSEYVRDKVFKKLHRLPSFVVTIEEPTLGSKPKVVIPKSLEPVFEQENFAALYPVEGKGEDAESEVPTEPEESIVEPEPAEQPSDGEPTIPQPSESPEDTLPSGETKGTPPIS